jgi:hypothetical protein
MADKDDKDPFTRKLELSQRQYAAIGKVACKWAYVESTLREYFAAISGVDPSIGAVVTAELGLIPLLTLIYSVCFDEKAPIYQRLKALEPELHRLRIARNTVVHLDWLREAPGRAAALKFTAKGKFDIQVHKWTTREMERLARDIGEFEIELGVRLMDFQNGTLRPLPAKPQRQPRKGRSPP